MKFLQFLLYPVSLLYGLVMWVRNILFDLRILPSLRPEKAVIGIGNLSLGGTGKTPMVEYLIRLLKDRYFVATLSRGYGRETGGFILGSIRSNVKYIGDEPLQYVKKYEGIKVAVDEQRCRGILHLEKKYPDLDVILLDDAFQHRSVSPGLSILLTDFHHLYTEDHVIPSGYLREWRTGARRADIIVVTKTPKIFSPITRRRIQEEIKPRKHQKLFFSFIRFGNPAGVYEPLEMPAGGKLSYILLFTGVAHDYPLREHLERLCNDLEVIKFRDHHPYTTQDMEMIRKKFEDLPSQKKMIITTEKDMMRLKSAEFSTIMKNIPLFYIPIETAFHGEDGKTFNKLILEYVDKNKRNRRVPEDENTL